MILNLLASLQGNNNLKRSFIKPRQPPPSFRAQSRQSYPGSSAHSARGTNGLNPTYTPSVNKTLLSLLQSKRSSSNPGPRNSLPPSRRLNSNSIQNANYDYRKSGSGRQLRTSAHGNPGTGRQKRVGL